MRWGRFSAWLVLAGVLASCGGGKSSLGDAGAGGTDGAGPGTPKLDLLVMVKNSGSMSGGQVNLAMNISGLTNVLEAMPGGPPDLHVAVVSSDLGAGDGSIPGCSGDGDRGAFQHLPMGVCLDTTLESGATFISDSGGATHLKNFGADDVAAVLSCIVMLGSAGCGFEHELAAIARALGADGAPPPPENTGFLRADATLAILMLADDDDCSAPNDSVLYDDPANTGLASPMGPLSQFRCAEFGYFCSRDGSNPTPPPRLSPNANDLSTTLTYDTCVSSEGEGLLTPVATFVRQIKSLKADPERQILVGSFQGPLAPLTEQWEPPQTADSGPWPRLLNSCNSVTGLGSPGVRLQQFVQSFGDNGLVYSFCLNTYRSQLEEIGSNIVRLMNSSESRD